MKKVKNEKLHKKGKEKGEIFVKVMAAFLALLMVAGTGASFIFALING